MKAFCDEIGMKKFVFKFIVRDSSDAKVPIEIRKIISLLGPSELLDVNSLEYERVTDQVFYNEIQDRRLEYNFGIHDVGFSPDDDEIWGYTSYEVPKDKIDELMEIWRDILVKAGYQIGKTETEIKKGGV